MPYPQKLSEQLARKSSVFGAAGGTGFGTGTTSTTTSTTISAFDMRDYHRIMIAAWCDDASTSTTGGTGTISTTATAALQIKVQASTSSAFGGTPTTITTVNATSTATASTSTTGGGTTTATASTDTIVDISGEDVQSQRVAEDRYVRAIITFTGVRNASAMTFADCSRYKPA